MKTALRFTLVSISLLALVPACLAACSGDDDDTSAADGGTSADATTDHSVTVTPDSSLAPDTGASSTDAGAADADASAPDAEIDVDADAGPIPVVSCGKDGGADASDGDVCPLPASTCVNATDYVYYSGGTCGPGGTCSFARHVVQCPSFQQCINDTCAVILAR